MKTHTETSILLCPNGCDAPVDCNATKYGFKVRLCHTCGYTWTPNPVLDLLQQARAIALRDRDIRPVQWTPTELASLDQVKARFQGYTHELS